MKHLKHTLATCMYIQRSYLLLQYPDEALETLENMHLQHAHIVITTYEISQIHFCNIQIKHLKHKFKNT
jgi:hypothetical protein